MATKSKKTSNTVRDVAFSVMAASAVAFVILFGVQECSCDEHETVKNEKKTPKIEVVNNNNVIVSGGNADIKNNNKIVVGIQIYQLEIFTVSSIATQCVIISNIYILFYRKITVDRAS